MTTRKSFLALVATAALASWTSVNAESTFPDKPVKLVVPVAAGGGIDAAFRAVAPAWGEALGQQVVIENRPGGGQVLGTNLVAKSPPDGYTILGAGAPIAFNVALGRKLPYDTARDLTPVAELVKQPLLVAVHPSVPVKTMAELVAWAKQAQGTPVQFTSGGIGSYSHLWWEMFSAEQGAKTQHIAYNGIAPALQDVLAGRVPVLIDALIPTGAHVKASKLRGLGLVAKDRSAMLPDLATLDQQGFKGYEAAPFYGVLAPGGTSPAIVQKLNDTLRAALSKPEVRGKLEDLGFVVVGGSPSAYGQLIQSETAKWSEVVKRAGIKVE